MGFWGTVFSQIKKAFEPIPAKLQEQYTFWATRKYKDPKVIATMQKLSDMIPEVALKMVLSQIQMAYNKYGADYVKDKIHQIDTAIAYGYNLSVDELLKLFTTKK